MDDPGEGIGSPPNPPHDGEDDAELSGHQDVSPDGIFVNSEDDEPSNWANPESASPEEEGSPGSSRTTPMVINDDEHVEEAQPEGPEGSQPPEDEPAPGHDEDDHADENDEMESCSDNDSDEGQPCTRQCQQQARQKVRKIDHQAKRIVRQDKIIDDLREQLRAAKLEITRLKRELRQYTGDDSPSPDREIRWQDMLRSCIAEKGPSYEAVWKESYRSLNMSTDPNWCHPQIRFTSHEHGEEVFSRQSSPSDQASVEPDEQIRAPAPPLPDNVVFRILKELLDFDGKLIHCLSRLDPYCRPERFSSAQDLHGRSTGLRGRFFFSSEPRTHISLTYDTEDPNVILAPLCVCRKWAWIGCHIFYSKNTFAFSSLGELDRVATGWGVARIQRCQNLELCWISGKSVSFKLDSNRRLNRRTAPLSWLTETASLKTLCVHIRELSHMRRSHEPQEEKDHMTGKTSGQANYRMTRSMRTTLGMDYLYQLRGLYWCKFYCLDKEMNNPDRSQAEIRDQSFRIDVERATTQRKVPARQQKCLLENLDPLFPVDEGRWIPGPSDIRLVRHLFHEDTGYDCRRNDLDLNANSSEGTIVGDSEAADSADDSDGDDSGSSGSSSPPPPGGPRSRVVNTPAPGADSREGESDHSGSDGDHSDNDSGNNPDDSLDTIRRRRLVQYRRRDSTESERSGWNARRAQSEGGIVSHISDDLGGEGIEIPSDDEERTRSSNRIPNRSSSAGIFVSPNPGERSTGTPDFRRRSSSDILRRASSAPRAPSLLHNVVDLTQEDNDKEGKEEDPAASETGRPRAASARMMTGRKRSRRVSPPSEDGSEQDRSQPKRLKSVPARAGSVVKQDWKFPA